MNYLNSRTRMLVLLWTAGILSACASHAQKVGSTSMQFLKVIPSARAASLGEAYTVWATGAEAIFWNPGGLAKLDGLEISTTYVDWLFDAQQGALACAFPVRGFGAVGLQIQYVDFGEFEETSSQRPYINNPENPGFTGNTFRPFGCVMGISYARALTNKFSVGMSVKYAYESLYNGEKITTMVRQGVYEDVKTWAGGILFDVGIRYDTGYRSVHIGSSVQNFGADMHYAKESSPVPLLFRFGIGADLMGQDGLLYSGRQNRRLGVAFDIFHPNDYAQQVHIGAEYEYASLFALRAGYKFNYDYDGLTLGAGVRHALEGIQLSLDYSYGDMGTYLGHVKRISIGIILP